MTLRFKGNVSVANSTSLGSTVVTSVNGVLANQAGEVTVDFNNYMSGDLGDTIIFKQTDNYKMSKLVNVAYIITLDAELDQCKSVTTDNIYDARNGNVWINTSGTWSVDTSSTLYTKLDKGAIFTNTITRRAFLINSDNSVSIFSGTSQGTALGQVPGMENFIFTTDANGGVQYFPMD